ncbi:MAG TPA: hypothetical protein VF021_12120 [Longimicrobiales bacterium]
MTDERFAEFVKTTLDEVDPVPVAPRDEIWARIEAQRALRKRAQGAPRKVWISWGVGLAAMLALGIGIGRMTSTHAPGPLATVEPATRTGPATATAPESVNRTAYRLVVAQYMSSAEALLTSFRAQPQGTFDPDIAIWARDMLTNTRMLLDSPAAADPKTAALLEDLELVIAQIARMSAPSQLEREMIRDGINKTAVLPRVRATLPAGPASAGT